MTQRLNRWPWISLDWNQPSYVNIHVTLGINRFIHLNTIPLWVKWEIIISYPSLSSRDGSRSPPWTPKPTDAQVFCIKLPDRASPPNPWVLHPGTHWATNWSIVGWIRKWRTHIRRADCTCLRILSPYQTQGRTASPAPLITFNPEMPPCRVCPWRPLGRDPCLWPATSVRRSEPLSWNWKWEPSRLENKV